MKVLMTSLTRDAARFAELQQEHPTVDFVVPPEGVDPATLIEDVEVLVGMLTADQFARAARLRWVQSPRAGVEWIARVPGLVESDVIVTNLRGAHAVTIAEHTFALLLSLTRALRPLEERQRRHEWAGPELRDQMRALKGLTMGIVGFGTIGRAIARRAIGFEMDLLAVDAEPVAPSDGVAEVWPLTRLDELCTVSDVLVIAAPLTARSRGMIGPEQIRRLKRGSYLLQVSRGGIVDEAALVDALEEGHLAGAGLDVTATEPLPVGHPLWTAPNLIVTPHSSAVSDLTSDLVYSMVSDNLGRYLRGEPLLNLVDKQRGY